MLRIGVIGTGVMGAEQARLLHEETSGAQLAGVYDPDQDRATAAARGAQIFSDPEALILSGAIDAVVIASPDASHMPLTLTALAAGKPVLCEKPLAPTPAQALQVVEAEVEAYRRYGRRLVQLGYMRRHDAGYRAMRAALTDGMIGAPVILHNIHRNLAAPDWFSGPMAITNSFVHEIDISRWLLGSDPVEAQVHSGAGGDPLLITMRSASGVLISTEVFINAAYGYHVHAQLVGRAGTVELAPTVATISNLSGQQSQPHFDNWVPRFRDAYRVQMTEWVRAIRNAVPCGASAWDGYAATALAAQVVQALESGQTTQLHLPPRPAIYD